MTVIPEDWEAERNALLSMAKELRAERDRLQAVIDKYDLTRIIEDMDEAVELLTGIVVEDHKGEFGEMVDAFGAARAFLLRLGVSA